MRNKVKYSLTLVMAFTIMLSFVLSIGGAFAQPAEDPEWKDYNRIEGLNSNDKVEVNVSNKNVEYNLVKDKTNKVIDAFNMKHNRLVFITFKNVSGDKDVYIEALSSKVTIDGNKEYTLKPVSARHFMLRPDTEVGVLYEIQDEGNLSSLDIEKIKNSKDFKTKYIYEKNHVKTDEKFDYVVYDVVVETGYSANPNCAISHYKENLKKDDREYNFHVKYEKGKVDNQMLSIIPFAEKEDGDEITNYATLNLFWDDHYNLYFNGFYRHDEFSIDRDVNWLFYGSRFGDKFGLNNTYRRNNDFINGKTKAFFIYNSLVNNNNDDESINWGHRKFEYDSDSKSNEFPWAINKLQKEIDSLNSKISELNNNINELNKTISEKEKEIQKLTEEKEKLNKSIDQKNREIVDGEEAIKEKEKEVSELVKDKEELEKEKEDLTKDLDKKKEELTNEKQNTEQNEEKIKSLEDKIKELEEKISKNEQLTKEANDKIQKKENEINDLKEKVKKITDEKSDLEKHIEELEKTLKNKDDELVASREKLDSKTKELDTITKDLENKTKELKEAKDNKCKDQSLSEKSKAPLVYEIYENDNYIYGEGAPDARINIEIRGGENLYGYVDKYGKFKVRIGSDLMAGDKIYISQTETGKKQSDAISLEVRRDRSKKTTNTGSNMAKSSQNNSNEQALNMLSNNSIIKSNDFTQKFSTGYAAGTNKNFSVFMIGVNYWNEIKNGTALSHQMDANTSPYIKDSRTYLPLRFVANSLDLDVKYDDATRTATFTNNKNSVLNPGWISINIDTGLIKKSTGETIKPDNKPIIKNNRIYAPVAVIANLFGASQGVVEDNVDQTIEWDQNKSSVYIFKNIK